MKPSYLLISFLLVVLLVACSPAQAQNLTPTPSSGLPGTQSSTNGAGWTLIYNRSGGLAGMNQTWTLYSDGRMLDDQDQPVKVSSDRISALVAEINQVDFFSYSDDYGKSSTCNDCFTTKLSFTKDGQTKTILIVEDGSTQIPNQLQTLVQNMSEILNSPVQ